MKKSKKAVSVILAALMLISVFVAAPITVNAGAPTYLDPSEEEPDNSEPDTNKAIDSSAFSILNPVESGTYYVNKSIELQVGISRYYYSYSANGTPQNSANVIKLEITKGNDVSNYTFNYYNDDVGYYLTDTFVPKSAGVYTLKAYYQGDYEGSINFEVKELPTKTANTLAVSSSVKTVKATALQKKSQTIKPVAIKNAKGSVKVSKDKSNTTSSIYSKVSVNSSTGTVTIKKGVYKAGTYKIGLSITAKGNDNYNSKTISKTVTFKIKGKALNTIKVKAASKTLKTSALNKSKKTVKLLTIKNAKGAVKVAKVKKGTSSSIYNKISVNKKTGAITLNKGNYKKGTYKVKLKITAKGNSLYKSKTINKVVKLIIEKPEKKKKESSSSSDSSSNSSSNSSSSSMLCPNCHGTGIYNRPSYSSPAAIQAGTPVVTYFPERCGYCGGDGYIN